MRIGILGHVGNQNLGDEALIAAVLQNVRRRRPETELCGFTGRPHDTRERHCITAFPIRRSAEGSRGTAGCGAAYDPAAGKDRGWARPAATLRNLLARRPRLAAMVRAVGNVFRTAVAIPQELVFLIRSYRRLDDIDWLLIAGSAQLSDYWGGPWGFPFTLLKWSLLARSRGTKVALLSVGAGPLNTRLGKFFIKQTVRLAHYRSYRDDDSCRCVRKLGVPGEHPMVPDLVFSLRINPPPRSAAPARRRIVGINPMPVLDDHYWPERDPCAYRHYLQTMASFADWLLRNGYDVRFFPTQLLVDHQVIEEVRHLMELPGGGGRQRVVADRINSMSELVTVIDGLDLVVATRYHGAVFSLIRQKPVISIAYQAKSVELMRQIGLGEYAVEIGRISTETLRTRFLSLESHYSQVVDTLRRGLPALQRALDIQYDQVLTQRGVSTPGSPDHEVFTPGRSTVSRALRPPVRRRTIPREHMT